MARVLRGEYDSIRLEPPGPEGTGIEFWLRRGSGREYHQVRRQCARRGHWTLSGLKDSGVLQSFHGHLADPNATCVFVSMEAANDLRELAERAQAATDTAEFLREFTKGGRGSKLNELATYWPGCEDTALFSRLGRIIVRTVDEVTLRRLSALELAGLVDGDASTVSDLLFVHAFESVHQELGAREIHAFLASRGFNRPTWAESRTLFDIVKAANDRYLAVLDRELIRGELIDRDEGISVLGALQAGATKRGVVLTGDAGSGKSTVLLQVVRALQQRGVPVLAVRVDRLSPTQLPEDAGRQMGLPTSPVAALANITSDQVRVLIVDQLDAVSLTSGRNPSFFECFDEMIRQALTLPEIRVVVACRRFDLENDHRLLRLGEELERIEVGPLSESVVRGIVKMVGVDAGQLGAHQLRLLSVPAHLKLFADAAEGSDATRFCTAGELYDLFWRRKQLLVQARLGRPVAWAAVIDALCGYMNQHQVLSAPEALLDMFASDATAMISEQVLVKDATRVAFFHEGFFDYAFARRSAARGDDLIGLLRSDEQHLFRRAQVRQILLHQREADRRCYLGTVRTLLASADIRFHIKQVVFSLLTQLADPSEEEWRILDGLLAQPNYAYRRQVCFAIRSLPWFIRLDSLGVVADWLGRRDADIVDQAVMLLSSVQRDAADRVAELIEPYVGASEEWRRRHRFLVQWADLGAGRRFFDLFVRLVDAGDLDGVGRLGPDDFFGLLYELSEKDAAWCCEAVGRYLDRCLSMAAAAGETNPFRSVVGLRHSQVADRVLIGSAQRSPGKFVEHVLPFMLRAMELNVIRSDDPPWQDTIWRWRRSDGGCQVDGYLLTAAEEALRALARETPHEFRCVTALLRQCAYETAQFLLVRAYAANGQEFADEAIDYLCESSQRLNCGYADSPTRACRELIGAITPYCSSERLVRLEAALLGYYTRWERTGEGCRSRGASQFELLLAIDKARRSTAVQARIGEWRRKFGIDHSSEPVSGGFARVRSPIATSSAERMTDDHWLRAIMRYDSDEGHEWRDGKPFGGARELSEVLEGQTRQAPLRFSRLVLRIPDGANPRYFDAVLRGLDTGAADAEALFAACRRCQGLPKRPVGAAFCRLVEKLPELVWPADLLDAVAWYATEDPDPDRELWRTEASEGRCYYGGDIYTAGINSVRGAAAGAVRALLFAAAARLPRLLPTLRRMVCDPSIAVRSCVATALLPVLNHDPDLALELFLTLCDTEDALLKTRYAEEVMRYVTPTHFTAVRSIVDRMLRSSDRDVAQTGARRACFASLGLDHAVELADRCMAGSEPLRVGAAQVFAANLGDARFSSACEARLVQLFDDVSDKVRAAAAECFDQIEDDELAHMTALVERFQESASFAEHWQHVIRALRETAAPLPAVTLDVCERVIVLMGEAVGDIRRRAALHDRSVSDLLVRVYHQASDDGLRRRCLDLVDESLSVGVFGLQGALAEFDR